MTHEFEIRFSDKHQAGYPTTGYGVLILATLKGTKWRHGVYSQQPSSLMAHTYMCNIRLHQHMYSRTDTGLIMRGYWNDSFYTAQGEAIASLATKL